MVVGILALQGAVKPHELKFKALGVETLQVRTPAELTKVDGIVLPGGESTAMIHIAKRNQIWEPLKLFVNTKPAWGICAGAILLAKTVSHPAQDSLGVLDVLVQRNAYGRQIDSFIGALAPTEHWPEEAGSVSGVFIRAPIFRDIGAGVKPLLRHKDQVVMVEQENLIASTFHPELTESTRIHHYFVNIIQRTA